MGLVIGGALGMGASVAVNEAVLFLAWHGNGPTWFYGVCVIVGVTLGYAGGAVGVRRWGW